MQALVLCVRRGGGGVDGNAYGSHFQTEGLLDMVCLCVALYIPLIETLVMAVQELRESFKLDRFIAFTRVFRDPTADAAAAGPSSSKKRQKVGTISGSTQQSLQPCSSGNMQRDLVVESSQVIPRLLRCRLTNKGRS